MYSWAANAWPAGTAIPIVSVLRRAIAGTGKFCGTQFIPGLGIPSSPQLYPPAAMREASRAGGLPMICAATLTTTSTSRALTCLTAPPQSADGDGSMTDIASLFGCNEAGPNANPANKTSCYNSAAATAGCCGCATVTPSTLSLPLWPTTTVSCGRNNSTWASSVQPWLANLKQACPTAYSYPFDDPTSTFQCREQGTTNLLGYTRRVSPVFRLLVSE